MVCTDAVSQIHFSSLCCGICEPQCYTPTCASYVAICADDDMPICCGSWTNNF